MKQVSRLGKTSSCFMSSRFTVGKKFDFAEKVELQTRVSRVMPDS